MRTNREGFRAPRRSKLLNVNKHHPRGRNRDTHPDPLHKPVLLLLNQTHQWQHRLSKMKHKRLHPLVWHRVKKKRQRSCCVGGRKNHILRNQMTNQIRNQRNPRILGKLVADVAAKIIVDVVADIENIVEIANLSEIDEALSEIDEAAVETRRPKIKPSTQL
jgi:hypothetical protein